MKKLLLIIAMVLMATIVFGDNDRASGTSNVTGWFEEAIVDADPGTDGYGCKPVNTVDKRGLDEKELAVYIDKISTGATVTLKSRRKGRSYWSIYGTYTEVIYKVLHNNAHAREWIMIIEDGDHGTPGETTVFGIEW